MYVALPFWLLIAPAAWLLIDAIVSSKNTTAGKPGTNAASAPRPSP